MNEILRDGRPHLKPPPFYATMRRTTAALGTVGGIPCALRHAQGGMAEPQETFLRALKAI